MDIAAIAMTPYDWPDEHSDAAATAPQLASPGVSALLRHADEVMLTVAWRKGTAPVSTGWLVAASAAYGDATGLVDDKWKVDAHCTDAQILAVIRAADACAAMGGWGHLNAAKLVEHLVPETRR